MRLSVLLALSACTGETYSTGRSELVQVRDATFETGDLPSDASATTPFVSYAAGANYVVTQGQGNVSYKGLVSPDSYSVAVAATDFSEGYWVVPLGGPDVTQDNNLILSLTLDFLPEVPYGLQTLSFVAIDGDGDPGPRYDSSICVLRDIADNNLSACAPDEILPPNRVISLTWDTPVDLDLIVIAPNGKVVSWDAPTTGLLDGSSVPREVVQDETTGTITRDSNSDCDIDGIQLESILFPGEPPAGDYLFYADLHSACDASYVNFSLDAYERVEADDGTFPVETTPLGTGELVATQADAGAALGTFLTRLTLP